MDETNEAAPGELTIPRLRSGQATRKSVFVEVAAVRLGVSRRTGTVYYRIREGKLQTIRTPGGSQRVLVESIEGSRRSGARRKRSSGEVIPVVSGFSRTSAE